MYRKIRHIPVIVLTVFILVFTPKPAAAQGDLVYHLTAQAALNASGWTVGIGMVMTSEGDVYDATFDSGWQEVVAEVYYPFAPRYSRRPVSVASDYYVYYAYQEPAPFPSLSEGDAVGPGVRPESQFGDWIYLGSLEESIDLPGAGPPSVKFIFDGFIDEDWSPVPLDPFDSQYMWWYAQRLAGGEGNAIVAESDNREHQRLWNAADHRAAGTTSRFNVRFEATNTGMFANEYVMAPTNFTVLSQTFEAVNSLSDWAGSGCWECIVYDGWGQAFGGGVLKSWVFHDWSADDYGKLRWGHASDESMQCTEERLQDHLGEWTSSLRISCSGAPYFPLHSIGSWIALDYEFVLTLTFGNDALTWTLEGLHDDFPNFAAYIGESAVAHTGGSTLDPFSMLGGASVPISNSGVIFYSCSGC